MRGQATRLIHIVVLLLAVAAAVSACGGGDGVAPETSPPPEPEQPPTVDPPPETEPEPEPTPESESEPELEPEPVQPAESEIPPEPELESEPEPEPESEPQPEPEPEQPAEPELPPEPDLPLEFDPLPVALPACIDTVLGCLTPESYEAERRAIEDAHAAEESFRIQWGLEAVRADRAYAQLELKHGLGLEPGSGQTVGLIDTGIDTAHPVFAGKTVSEIFSVGAQDETGDEFSHGTAVASIVAAGRGALLPDSQASTGQGIAWGADIAMFALRAGSGGGPYHPIVLTGQSRVDERWAARITQVTDWSSAGRTLDFVNVSVGFHGIIEQYSEQDLREFFGGTIAALAQSGAADRTVFVWAGGNGHGRDCTADEFSDSPALCVDGLVNARSVEVMPGMAARIPELQGSVVAVVAVAPDDDGDGDHEIAAFSNRCGIAKDWCIAAPGVDMWAAYFGPYQAVSGQRLNALVGGTSVASPLVTGALVAMKDYFRDELANTDLVARLLATADKSGIYGDADVYGQGLLDLAAATAPVGSPTVAVAERVEGGGVELAATALGLGDAFGDGLTRALAGQEIAAFDDLGAPFLYALDSFADAASGPSAGARLRGFTAQPRAGWERLSWRPSLTAGPNADGASEGAALRLGMLEEPSPGEEAGHLSLAGRGLALSTAGWGELDAAAFSTEGLDMRAPASGATFAWRPAGAPLAVRGGWIGERHSLLGSRATGAFGRMTASSAFAGIQARERFGAWRLGAGAEIGTVNATTKGGLIAGISPLTTSAFAFQAVRPLGGEDTLALSLSQPLRVESGRASLSVPVGRTKDGAVRRHAVTADLVPTGRQIDVAARWRRALSANSELRLAAIWSRQPGHAAAAEPELTLFAGWRHTF